MEPMKRSKKLLKTFLMGASVLFLTSCSCLPRDPEIKPKQYLKRLNKCKQYTMKFEDRVVFKFEKDLPLSECLVEGNFIITADELVSARNFYNEAKKCYDEKCR